MKTADRTGEAAISYARSRVGGSMPASGYCLQFTRECYSVPAVYGSAGDAGRACNAPHPYDRNPPPGVPVWFWTPSVYDHICFFVGPNEVISTFNEEIRSFNGIASIEANFNGTYAGWGEDVNEYAVLAPVLPPPIPEEDDDMKPMFLRAKTGAIVIVNGNGVQPLSLDHWQVWQNLGYGVTHDDMDEGPFNALIEDLGGWA